MAKIFLTRLFLIAVLLILLVPLSARAFSINLPIGGKILTLRPEITCPDGKEVFDLKPVTPVPPGPFYLSATTKRFKYFSVSPNRWLLGLYDPLPKICVIGVPPTATTIPVWKITMFGSSLF